MNCGICNQEMEHLESVGMICTSCDIEVATDKNTEVYVVVNMWNGLVEDVSVHTEEPKDLEPIDEDGDNGNFIYHLEIQESDNDT
mgnify:FL=1